MESINITLETILALFGGITVLAGGVKVIIGLTSPFKKLHKRVEVVEHRVDSHEGYLRNDKASIDELSMSIKENRRMNIALLNHFIDGNGVEHMKEMRDTLQDKL